jgi:subtilase family serine protease
MLIRKSKCLLFSGLMAAAICTSTSVTAATSTTVAAGNVSGWVRNAVLAGPAAASTSVTIAVHLALQNTAELKTLVGEVSSPSNAQYGHYLTTAEFAGQFAPASADVQAVQSLLQKAGMTNIQVGPYGAYVSATATVAQLRTAFNISQNLYTYKGLTLRANSQEPTIPSALAAKILFIEGLDDSGLLRTPSHRSEVIGNLVAPASAGASAANTSLATTSASTSTSTVTPPPVAAGNPSPYCNTYFGGSSELVATLSTAADVYGTAIPWLNCGYTPQQIQAAYGFNQVAHTGKGVTVAILDAYASPTLLADANRYAANHSLPPLVLGQNFSQIIPAGIYSVSPSDPCGPYGWWLEESLDMAAVHGTATGANILYVGSTDCGTSLTLALHNVLYNHLADVVTNSYGYGGEAIAVGQQASDDQAFMAGSAMGTTILFSSGDDGDLSQDNGVASGAWPATSPYVTGVGGTSLLLQNSSGAKKEYGWGNYRDVLADAQVNSAKSVTTSGPTQITAYGATFDDYAFYAGSGGGISLLEAQPAYQAAAVPLGLATTLNLSSGYTEPLPNAQRVSPDMAMVGDPYTGYLFGETFTIAGSATLDHGCKAISATEEYCENAEGGTSLSSPLMAGVIAVMDSKRADNSLPPLGFANPLLYKIGSTSNGVTFNQSINQIVAPSQPTAVLRAYAANLELARVVTISSVPFLITTTTPFALEVCGIAICEGLDDIFNFTSLSSAAFPPTTAGYNDVTGLGVPWLPVLINQLH